MASIGEISLLHGSEDGRRVSLQPVGDGPSPPVPAERIRDSLGEKGVVHGIAEEALSMIATGTSNGTPPVVAEATAPVPGSEGWVELVVPEDSPPSHQIHTGRVDVQGRCRVRNVSSGHLVAIIHQPTPGVPGRGVDGSLLPAQDGKPADIILGEGVAVSPDDPSRIVATGDGCPILKADGTIEVTQLVTIEGSVDLSVGDIDFVGSLVVRGDILSDFTVKVTGTLEVHGNVEDARIETGGDVVIHQGFYGSGKGTLTSGGTVRVQHILNQTIHAARDVQIEKEAVNATVVSGGAILAPRAVIAGGMMDALRDIEAGTLGSADGGQARVRSGKRGRLLERVGQLDRDIKHSEKQLGDVKRAVFTLIKMKVDGHVLTAEQESTLGKLQEAQKLIPKRIEQYTADRAKLTEDLQKNSEARVVVRGTVYENVVIDINGVRKVMDSSLTGVVFTEHNGAISIQGR